LPRGAHSFSARGVVDVVVDEEPRLGEAAVGEELERLAGGGRPVLRLLQAADEDGAELDEALLDALEAHRASGPPGAQPPHAGVAVALAPGIFAGERRHADAAEAVHGGGLRHRRRLPAPQGRVQGLELVDAAREARRRPDLGVQDGARGAPSSRPPVRRAAARRRA
jgi:hypothetical protein